MQRSFSSSYADHQHNHRSSTGICRHLPVRHVYNNGNDYYLSDTDSQHQTYLQHASSTSSFSSTSSAGSASYRILPVRYSSVDRILPKPPRVTANDRGIKVRINFDRPHHHHHHHHRRHNIEESEHHRHKQMTKEHQEFSSCPVLNGNHRKSTSSGRSNITYIETRSIVRGCSNDQLNQNNHSNSMIIRERSNPKSPLTKTRIRHIPLNQNFLSTRVIRGKEE
jgi:hypothetical protein